MPLIPGEDVETTDWTGIIFPSGRSVTPAGFLPCDGAAVSRSTYADLFAAVGTAYGVGDGSTTFNVPDLRSSVPLGAGQRTRVVTFDASADVNVGTDQIAVALNSWMITGQAVVLAGSALPTGLTAGTYYVIRVDATHIKLASTLANAQNGTAVDITVVGTGSATLTQTLTSRSLGDTGGEETHAMSATELLAHTHAAHGSSSSAGSGNLTIASNTSGTTYTTDPTGGNAAMNVMPPNTVVSYIIKT